MFKISLKIFIAIVLLSALAAGGFWSVKTFLPAENSDFFPITIDAGEPTPVNQDSSTTTISAPRPVNHLIINNVPFTSQAPFGDWQNTDEQNGCEEASVLMAVRWAEGQGLTPAEALKEILAAAAWQRENYGESRDTSAEDTLDRLVKGYFGHKSAELKKNISLDDIINELRGGKLVIAPVDGQLLNNPNYTAPGPPEHMLVILGFDEKKKIFITNDPGTRKGRLYQYDFNVLYSAIRDYPTGYHEPIDKIEKNIIIVGK